MHEMFLVAQLKREEAMDPLPGDAREHRQTHEPEKRLRTPKRDGRSVASALTSCRKVMSELVLYAAS